MNELSTAHAVSPKKLRIEIDDAKDAPGNRRKDARRT